MLPVEDSINRLEGLQGSHALLYTRKRDLRLMYVPYQRDRWGCDWVSALSLLKFQTRTLPAVGALQFRLELIP